MHNFAHDLQIILEAEHDRVGYETDFRVLAQLLGIHVMMGKWNLATNGPPAVIQVRREEWASRLRFTGHHEIVHVLMQRSGLEDDVIAYYNDPADAKLQIEVLANFGAGLLMMPWPMLDDVRRKHRNPARVVPHLARTARASLPAALRRYVYDDLEAERAAFITNGNYIADVVTCNFQLPFCAFDRVPDVGALLPDVNLAQVYPGKLIGVAIN